MGSQIGLYFGSFNPVHNGHLAVADYMLAHAGLDEIWMVVSPSNPFKTGLVMPPEADRLAMVQLALADRTAIRASDVEFSLPRPSYTICTLRHLSAACPQHRFSFIMGSDCLEKFASWRQADEIVRDYERLVYPRPGTDPALLQQIVHGRMVDAPQSDVSSTQIRHLLAAGASVSGLIPPAVEDYIRRHGLYTQSETAGAGEGLRSGAATAPRS